MGTHSEHKQDDADLRQLRSKLCVGDEAGGERADDDTGQKISHQRRQTQSHRQQSTNKCKGQADGYGRDQRNIMSGDCC